MSRNMADLKSTNMQRISVCSKINVLMHDTGRKPEY